MEICSEQMTKRKQIPTLFALLSRTLKRNDLSPLKQKSRKPRVGGRGSLQIYTLQAQSEKAIAAALQNHVYIKKYAAYEKYTWGTRPVFAIEEHIALYNDT